MEQIEMCVPFIRFWLWLPATVLCLGACAARAATPDAADEKTPPPYVFNLGGLSVEDAAKIKDVPGVLEVAPNGNRMRVVWRPVNVEGPFGTPDKWTKGAERLYDYLIVKTAGSVVWSHGGYTGKRSSEIVLERRAAVNFSFIADSKKLGGGIMMVLRCYNEALPGQVEHEMLRDVPGTNVTVEKCGDGYAIVSRAGRGTFVVWRVSEQMFVRIDNIFDREMVAAYIARLGSITPKDYKVSVDEWVQNEIKWRIAQLHWMHELELKLKLTESEVTGGAMFVGTFFPECYGKLGRPKWDSKPGECWGWIQRAKGWLWANRLNFKYDDETRGYVLKGTDRYDPQNPPELPPELRGPPKPE